MLIRILARVVPTNAREAFWPGFVLSLIFGLIIIFAVRPLTGLNSKFGNEGHDGYWQIAWNVARGNGFVFDSGGPPELHRPPLTPLLFVPLTFLPAGIQQPALVLLHSLMIGAVCFFLFDLASRTSGPRIAGMAVVVLLLYPWLYWHAKNPMNIITQMLGLVFMLDLMASEFLQPERPVLAIYPFSHPNGRLVVTGISAALLALTHGTTLPAITIMLLLIFAVGIVRRNRHMILAAVIPGVVAAVVIAPWTYRNWRVIHRFVPVVQAAGFAYYLGNVHWGFGLDGGVVSDVSEREHMFAVPGLPDFSNTIRFCGVTDAATANALSDWMVKDMKTHPTQLLSKIMLDAMEFYFPIVYNISCRREHNQNLTAIFEQIGVSIFHLTLWGLAFVGIWKAKDKSFRLLQLLILLIIGIFCLPYLPVIAYIGHAQYAATLVPLLAILTAGGILALLPALPEVKEVREPNGS
jgi:hypothetical protein